MRPKNLPLPGLLATLLFIILWLRHVSPACQPPLCKKKFTYNLPFRELGASRDRLLASECLSASFFKCRRAMFALPFDYQVSRSKKIKDEMSLRRRSYAQAPVIPANTLSERFVPSNLF
jgi:hypothetical protein